MIAIIVADEFEVKELPFPRLETFMHGKMKITSYESPMGIIHMILSGIGIVNAAVATHFAITQLHAKVFYNYGSAGGAAPLKLGEVVIPRRVYFLDAKTPWYDEGVTPGEPKHYANAPRDHGRYDLGTSSAFISSMPVFKGEGHEIKLFDMEAAGIAQVASHFKQIKVIIVKGISDLMDDKKYTRDEINHQISIAATGAFDKVLSIIRENKY